MRRMGEGRGRDRSPSASASIHSTSERQGSPRRRHRTTRSVISHFVTRWRRIPASAQPLAVTPNVCSSRACAPPAASPSTTSVRGNSHIPRQRPSRGRERSQRLSRLAATQSSLFGSGTSRTRTDPCHSNDASARARQDDCRGHSAQSGRTGTHTSAPNSIIA